jgi:hypothetical protein
VTGVHVVYEQNLSVMGVASCRSTFLCLMSRVRLVRFWFLVRDLIPFDGRACRGFRSAKWLGPARPGPALRTPSAPPPPPCAPSSPLSLIWISRAATSLPHLSLSPSRGALGFGVEIAEVGSRGEPLPLLSLSPSLPLPPLSPCARSLFSSLRA